MEKEPEQKVDNWRNNDGTFKAGHPHSKGFGRPNGAQDFRTKYFKFIEKIAEMEKVTPEDIENSLFEVGLRSAQKGDFKFWESLQDRVYGKAVQRTEIDSPEGSGINIVIKGHGDKGSDSTREAT